MIRKRYRLSLAIIIVSFLLLLAAIPLSYILTSKAYTKQCLAKDTPGIPITEALKPSNVKKVTVARCGRDWDEKENRNVIVSEIDVTDSKAKIIDCLQQNKYYDGTCGCSCRGLITFDMTDGGKVELGIVHNNFRYEKSSINLAETREFDNQPLLIFFTALDYDKTARVFDKQAMEKFLLPGAKKGDMSELDFLAELGLPSAATVLPQALKAAEAEEQTIVHLPLSLKNLKNIKDKAAIDEVAQFVKDDDLNTCYNAIDILKAWGHLDLVKGMANDKDYAGKNLASWFAQNRHIEEMICTVRTMGVEKCDLTWYSQLTWIYQTMQGPSPSWQNLSPQEQKKVLLLIADSLEHQTQDITTFTTAGIEYECNGNYFCEMQYELLSEMDAPEQNLTLERATRDRIYKPKNPMGSRALGPHMAQALRIWINNKWPNPNTSQP